MELHRVEPQLRHVAPQFVVADVVRTAEHYRDALGFTIGSYFGSPPVFAMVFRGPVWIQFGQADSQAIARNLDVRKLGLDAYVWMDNLDALVDELKARGANIVEGPVSRIYGMREVSVDDIDGHRIVFGESTEP
jgi:catechol 2,3-dioxygenase-like lactoylglutathione lyase family enzyme